MPRTQKNRPSEHEFTYHGIKHWYEAKFEKLGWMLLAKRNGYADKVMTYINSVKRLHAAIDQKAKHMRDKDKRDDLYIMKADVETLLEHIKKDFE